MRRMPVRQVHLDFHTSEFVGPVGEKFDKKQFQVDVTRTTIHIRYTGEDS